MIDKFLIRASYPNFFMVKLYADHGAEVFNHDSEDPANPLEGNKPGTVIYHLEGTPADMLQELPPRWYDMYYMLKSRGAEQAEFLQMLLEESNGAGEATKARLEALRSAFRQDCVNYVRDHPLYEDATLVTTLTQGDFTDEAISHKGRMLLDLTRNCYPVPDFCIITSEAFMQPERLHDVLEKAIANLEVMTHSRLGDTRNPLVFAIRCAMPQYIPGLMPTLLNIGVTRRAYEALRVNHADSMANRVYLSTLHSVSEMLGIEHKYDESDIELSDEMQYMRIAQMEKRITAARDDGERLLTDAHYQALQLMRYVRDFYIQNQDLILTFMQGKQAYPSFILQRMVWTIGNNESYPGVLYSRHSRTGKGRQIESYRNIFGEEIMTGDVSSEDIQYFDRYEIKSVFPAVYHFDPLLKKLETRYKSPVTIEFAVETRPHQVSLFSVLQLNMSEMTGRAALLSSIDMYNAGQILASHVMDLIKPYHLRQIVSSSIDDRSLSRLQFFGKGLSVLPRTAISATLCFSAATARILKSRGENVCLCQERFIPEDTITLNEVDAILSMTPAAIHVVTACRGYGIPAFMDLHSYGIRKDGYRLVNEEGLVLNELDKVTVSSKRQTIYKGVAAFKPARFTKYLHGDNVALEPDEEEFFHDMKLAYEQYQQLVTSEQVFYINDVNKLARLIRCDLQNKPEVARGIVNNWYSEHADLYIKQVLASKMGDHQDQSRVFNLLTNSNKTEFFRKAVHECLATGLTGLRAGSFMLGRFVAKPLPVAVWNGLSDSIVAFLLNEYVLYEKYLHVLDEVGEIRLARAHSRIETEGIDNMVIDNFDLNNFAPLVYATHDWEQIARDLEQMEHQDNTHLLVERLSRPPEEIYDLTKPWKRAQINSLLKL
ncbi:MAG: hypothetical protein J6X62_04145 [Bacteroidales bacterium]|nr:hypothetical protein [Bacteroidales bacterium]